MCVSCFHFQCRKKNPRAWTTSSLIAGGSYCYQYYFCYPNAYVLTYYLSRTRYFNWKKDGQCFDYIVLHTIATASGEGSQAKDAADAVLRHMGRQSDPSFLHFLTSFTILARTMNARLLLSADLSLMSSVCLSGLIYLLYGKLTIFRVRVRLQLIQSTDVQAEFYFNQTHRI